MSVVRDLGRGMDGFLRAFRFALKHRMGWMFLVPVALWVVLTFGLYRILEGPVEEFTSWLGSYLAIPVQEVEGEGWTATWNAIKRSLEGAREFLTAILLKIAVAYLLYKVNKYLVLILLSPLLAFASERTEEILTGRVVPFSMRQLLRDAWRGSLVALRNGVLELLLTIAIWLLTLLVPVLAPISFGALFLVSAYFYGFSMFDYVFERRQLGIGGSIQAINSRLGAVLANGACFSLLMKIPLLGIMVAPVMAAIGAVLVMVPVRSKTSEAQERGPKPPFH